jgi:L-seryl-tRNA(Ser) seleniumtransferase
MRKTPAAATHSGVSSLRAIPSVERLLSGESFLPLVEGFGRDRVKEALVRHLDGVRAARGSYEDASAVTDVAAALQQATASTLRRVINGSGVIIHTNLGRSPIDSQIWRAAGHSSRATPISSSTPAKEGAERATNT